MNRELIEQLIEIGQHAESELVKAIIDLKKLRLGRNMLQQGIQTWDKLTHSLPLNDVVALARSLTLIDTLPGLSDGSVSPVIWVFLELERRDYPGLLALAMWIIEHDKNPYVPFGTLARRRKRLDLLKEREELRAIQIQNSGRSNQLRKLMGELQFEHSYSAWLSSSIKDIELREKIEQSNREIAELKNNLKQLTQETETLRRYFTEIERAKKRDSLLQTGANLDPVGRLQLIAANPTVPIGVFPEEWACHEAITLSLLNVEIRRALSPRIARIRKGPWRKVYRGLCDLDGKIV